MEITQLKNKIDEMWALKKDQEEAKKVYSEKYKKYTEARANILAILEDQQLDKFEGTGCKVSMVTKSSVKFPKDPAAKKQVLNWIQKNYGAETLMGFVSINSNTFNSFYNKEEANALEKGELDFQIPGTDGKKEYLDLQVRKKS